MSTQIYHFSPFFYQRIGMSSDRDRQVLHAREMDKMSTVMVKAGVEVVKKNPIKVSSVDIRYCFSLL